MIPILNVAPDIMELGLQVIPPRWLRLFNAREVNQLLAGGESGGLDVADMRLHAHYSGGYRADSPTIKLFWKVGRSTSNPGSQSAYILSIGLVYFVWLSVHGTQQPNYSIVMACAHL